jgi:hypothetical protein
MLNYPARGVVLERFANAKSCLQEVFDRQGAQTSSRPRMRVAMDVLSGGYRMLFMVCGSQDSSTPHH